MIESMVRWSIVFKMFQSMVTINLNIWHISEEHKGANILIRPNDASEENPLTRERKDVHVKKMESINWEVMVYNIPKSQEIISCLYVVR